jgi:hypothetical protein
MLRVVVRSIALGAAFLVSGAIFTGQAWAQATQPVVGGQLHSGVPVAGSVTTADGTEYTFAAKAGQHVTVAISNANVSGALVLADYEGGSSLASVVFGSAKGTAGYTDFTVPSTGTVTVSVAGLIDDGATGTFTYR